MNVQYSTPIVPENASEKPLNLRWKFFKSQQGRVLAASFASGALSSNPHFVEISETEYRRLEREQNRV